MARKKSIKKRTRVIGEFEAQTTALLDGLWAELAEAEEQHELGRGKRTIWASEAEYAAIQVYLAHLREAGGAAPAGRVGLRLEAVLQAELAAVRVAQGVALARHREQQRARRDRWLEREAARLASPPERSP